MAALFSPPAIAGTQADKHSCTGFPIVFTLKRYLHVDRSGLQECTGHILGYKSLEVPQPGIGQFHRRWYASQSQAMEGVKNNDLNLDLWLFSYFRQTPI